MNQLSAAELDRIKAHILAHQGMPGGLMPLMHAIQDDIGYVPEEVYPLVSKAMALLYTVLPFLTDSSMSSGV